MDWTFQGSAFFLQRVFFSSEGRFFLLRGHFLGLEKGTASHLEDFEAKKIGIDKSVKDTSISFFV